MKQYILKLKTTSTTNYAVYDGTTALTDAELTTLFTTAGSAYFNFDFDSLTPSATDALTIVDSNDTAVITNTGLTDTIVETKDFKGTWSASATTFDTFTALGGVSMDEAQLSDLMGKIKGAGGIPADATFWGQSYDATNNRVNGQIGIRNPGANNAAIYGLLSSQSSSIYTGAISFGYSSGEVNIGRQRCSVPGNMDTIYAQFNNTSVGFARPLDMGWGGAGKSRIYNLENPTAAKDAANKQYVDSIYPVGAVFTSTSATAPTIAGGTWTEIGTQTIGSSTVHYYERTA